MEDPSTAAGSDAPSLDNIRAKRVDAPTSEPKVPPKPAGFAVKPPPTAKGVPPKPPGMGGGVKAKAAPPPPPTPTHTTAGVSPAPEAPLAPYDDEHLPQWWTPLSHRERGDIRAEFFTIDGTGPLPHVTPFLEEEEAGFWYDLQPCYHVSYPVEYRNKWWKNHGTKPSQITNWFFDIPQNANTIKAGAPKKELVMGVPATATLGGYGYVGERPKIDRVDFMRWAFSAFNGELFSLNENTALLDIAPEHLRMFRTNRPEGLELTRPSAEDDEAARRLADAVSDIGNPPADNDPANPIRRPNGELYIPRTLKTSKIESANPLYDVQVLTRSYRAGIPLLLYGPPGTGKTAMCEAALPDLITLSGTSDTEVPDFVGSFTPLADQSLVWVHGPLLRAMIEGRPLLVDEIALIEPRVLAILYSVMDGRGELTVTANPDLGVIKAEKGFYVVAACNPDVPGAVMSDALLSRFALQIEVVTDYTIAARLGVESEIITVATSLARKVAEGGLRRAPEIRELLAFQRIKNEFGRAVAIANLISTAHPNDQKTYRTTLDTQYGVKSAALKI